jgi:hypothetical protein
MVNLLYEKREREREKRNGAKAVIANNASFLYIVFCGRQHYE